MRFGAFFISPASRGLLIWIFKITFLNKTKFHFQLFKFTIALIRHFIDFSTRYQLITPEPISSSSLYQATNWPSAIAVWAFSKMIYNPSFF